MAFMGAEKDLGKKNYMKQERKELSIHTIKHPHRERWGIEDFSLKSLRLRGNKSRGCVKSPRGRP